MTTVNILSGIKPEEGTLLQYLGGQEKEEAKRSI
jgi:hypothetical protein